MTPINLVSKGWKDYEKVPRSPEEARLLLLREGNRGFDKGSDAGAGSDNLSKILPDGEGGASWTRELA